MKNHFERENSNRVDDWNFACGDPNQKTLEMFNLNKKRKNDNETSTTPASTQPDPGSTSMAVTPSKPSSTQPGIISMVAILPILNEINCKLDKQVLSK